MPSVAVPFVAVASLVLVPVVAPGTENPRRARDCPAFECDNELSTGSRSVFAKMPAPAVTFA